MHLLQSGVPLNVIALWLGHESIATTHRYVEADLAMKEKALARPKAPDTKWYRFHASDQIKLAAQLNKLTTYPLLAESILPPARPQDAASVREIHRSAR